jgi:hypothetical protein
VEIIGQLHATDATTPAPIKKTRADAPQPMWRISNREKSLSARPQYSNHSSSVIQLLPRHYTNSANWAVVIQRTHTVCTVKYTDDLVLLAKDEMALQDMIDKLIEIGVCCGMEMNEEKKAMRISRKSFTVKQNQNNWRMWNYLNIFM